MLLNPQVDGTIAEVSRLQGKTRFCTLRMPVSEESNTNDPKQRKYFSRYTCVTRACTRYIYGRCSDLPQSHHFGNFRHGFHPAAFADDTLLVAQSATSDDAVNAGADDSAGTPVDQAILARKVEISRLRSK